MKPVTETAQPDNARACPLCSADNANRPPMAEGAEWGLTTCGECGFVYLRIVPAVESLAAESGWEDTWEAEHQRRRREEPALHRVQNVFHRVPRIFRRDKLTSLVHRFLPTGRVLDVGCGKGHRSERLRCDVRLYGIEIEESVVEEANRRFARRGGYVVCAPAREALPRFEDGFFHGAILRAYLEHEHNPFAVLAALHPKLRPGSPVILKVPNHACLNRRVRGRRWCGYRFPEHVNYFTPGTLRRIMEKTGYRVDRFQLRDRAPLSDNMWMVARAS